MRISDWSSDVCSSDLGFGEVDGYQAAHARLAHGNAGQLLRGLHRRLVVGDKQELYLLAHLRDHGGEAADVGLVERRVDLVEQAERRRVELEDREHQRHGRSEEHTSELQSLMRISYAVFCLKKKKKKQNTNA